MPKHWVILPLLLAGFLTRAQSPTNDEPCNAIQLPVSSSCAYALHSNANATNTQLVPSPNCAGYLGSDVWFKVTIPVFGTVTIDTDEGSMTDGAMAVYSGSDCNSLTLLSCNDDGSANGLMPSITVNGLAAGSTLWIRIWEAGNDNNGTFGICAKSPPPPTVQDCPAAIPLCQTSYTQTVSYSGTGNLPTEINGSNSCLQQGERADVWYTFTVQTSGNLSFLISPLNSSEDYDWAVYNLTNANCSDIYSNPAIRVSCNFSATPGATGPNGGTSLNNQLATGTPFNAVIPVSAGETYVINVSNYSQSVNGYSINFGASTATILDNVPPTMISAAADNACSASTVNLMFSENILCSTLSPADFTVTGQGGPYTVTAVSSPACAAGATYGRQVVLTISPPITNSGNYQVCITGAAGSVSDLCGNLAVVSSSNCETFSIQSAPVASFSVNNPNQCATANNFLFNNTSNVPSGSSFEWNFGNGAVATGSSVSYSYSTPGAYTVTLKVTTSGGCTVLATRVVNVIAPATPQFSPLAVCSGAAPPTLPSTSLDGINGSWSPSVVNTSVTSSYLFTPAPGYCATQASITIPVTQTVTPFFNQVAPICSGDAFPALPTTSVNGISGTWSPAPNNLSTTTYVFTPSAGQCATSATMTITVNQRTAPAFNQISPICSGEFLAPFPTTSLQGVTGSWSPAPNNQATTTYTFTPFPGQCATLTSTMTVVVNPLQNPTFQQVGPVCSGTSFSLPSSSLEGISGTWSPSPNPFVSVSYTFIPNSGQCAAYTVMNVTVVPNVTPSFNLPGQVCQGDPMDPLPAVSLNGISGSWSPAPNNLITTTYYFTPAAGQCATNFSTLIAVNPKVDPLFTQVNPVCRGSVMNPLPGISLNGVTGTWSPALNNNQTTTYTFTPQAGQCANPAVMQIVVNPFITPSFPSIGPYCEGAFIPALPVVSNEGVSGSWTPALNNLYTTTYTFLPSAGQCALADTFTLVINPYVNPVFNAPSPVCRGGSVTPLPAVSLNGINGTWNPPLNNTVTTAYTFTPSQGLCANQATVIIPVVPSITTNLQASACSDDLPYIFNGQNYTASGTYSAVFNSSSGCDSTVVLQLSVIQPSSANVSASVCENQLPYSWNGRALTASGSYSATFVNAAGCDSLVTLNFTVKPVTSGVMNAAVCLNALPYFWNGSSYTVAGTYSVMLSNAAGCDSLSVLNLSVKQVTSSSTSVTVCPSQLPYAWNGQSYNAAGSYSKLLVNAAGCDSVAVLNLSVNTVSIGSQSASSCASALPYIWNGQSYAAAGSYTATFVSSVGCDSLAILNLSVFQPGSSLTQADICAASLPYTWNGLNYIAAGSYTTVLSNAAGCDSVAVLRLTVSQPTSSMTRVTLCSNVLPYVWNGQSYSAAGMYTVLFSNAAGCDSAAILDLTVRQPSLGVTAAAVCPASLPYNWNGNSYSAAGIYTALLTNAAGCDSAAVLNLSVSSVSISNHSAAVCPSSLPYLWNGISYNAAGSYTATLVSSVGCDSLAILDLSVKQPTSSNSFVAVCPDVIPFSWNGRNYNSAGTYTVTLVNAAGCDSFAILQLLVKQPTSGLSTANVCVNSMPYSWNGRTYNSAGTYTVTLVNAAGCDSVAVLELSVSPASSSIEQVTACESFDWHGNTYYVSTQAPVFVTTNAQGCDSSVRLDLTINYGTFNAFNRTACNSFDWNGVTYTTSGHFLYNYVNAAGCPSADTLHLAISSGAPSVTTASACDSYNWNGVDYASSGVYAFSYSGGGCNVTDTLRLTINYGNFNSQQATACGSYTWQGNVYNNSGTYVYNYLNATGCPSADTLHLVLNSGTFRSGVQAVCDSFFWNGNVYHATGNYSYSYLNNAGCPSTDTLHLTVYSGTYDAISQEACGSYFWNGQNYTQSGDYLYSYNSSQGCLSADTLHLTIHSGTFMAYNQSACDSYSWNGASYTASGDYVFNYSNSYGCASADTLHLNISNGAPANDSVAACDSYSWNGTTYTAGGIYSYSYGSGICNVTDTLRLAIFRGTFSADSQVACRQYIWYGNTYTVSGVYVNNYVNGNGCASADTLKLAISNDSAGVTVAEACGSYVWNGITYTSSGNYLHAYSNGPCFLEDTLVLTIRTGTFESLSQSACMSFAWNGVVYTSSGDYVFLYNDSYGCASADTLHLTISNGLPSSDTVFACGSYSWHGATYTSGGDYLYSYSSGLCNVTDTLHLTINSGSYLTQVQSACGSYAWNGTVYTASGIYVNDYLNNYGCASADTLYLTINAGTFGSQAQSACQTFTWNGNTYSASGSYVYNYSNGNGCPSADTLHLTISNGIPSSATVAACNSYTWNGTVYTAGGDYLYSYSSGTCNVTDTLHLTINSGTYGSEIKSACLGYFWNGVNYTSSGNYVYNYLNASGCPSADTLHLDVDVAVPVTNTEAACDSFIWNGNIYRTSGVYTYSYQSGACAVTDTLRLTINRGTFASEYKSACLSFNWRGNTYTATGNYIYQYRNSGGCLSADTLHLTISNGVPATYTVSACESYLWNGVTYTASGLYSYTFTGGVCNVTDTLQLTIRKGTFTTANQASCSNYIWNGVNYTGSGVYVNSYLNAAGCASADTLRLQIIPLPAAPLADPVISYCLYADALPLQANGQGTLLWYDSPSGGAGITTAPLPNTSSLGNSYYYVSQMIGSCEGPRATIQVRVVSKPQLDIDKDIRLCFGSSINLNSLYNTTGLTAQWSLNTALITDVSGIALPGRYRLIALNGPGCSDTAYVDLAIQPPVVANAGPDDSVRFYVPYQLQGSGGIRYLWEPGSPALNNPFIANPVALLREDTRFILTVEDDIGCKDRDTVNIHVILDDDFYMPNAFTPDGDGLNDLFRPYPMGAISDLEYLRVFDRYGKMIFETKDVTRGWDGMSMGRKVDLGNYVWVLKATNRRGEKRLLNGNVLLIR